MSRFGSVVYSTTLHYSEDLAVQLARDDSTLKEIVYIHVSDIINSLDVDAADTRCAWSAGAYGLKPP